MTDAPGERLSPLRQKMMDQMRLANLAENTQVCYLREITCLARDCKAPPDRLSAEQIHAWLLAGVDRGLSPASTNMSLAALRYFYCRVLRRPELVEGLRQRKVPRRLPRHMTVTEVERLLLATTDLRYRAAMLTAYAAGLRVSETLALQLADIRSDKRLLHIRSGKGGTERMAPLPEGALEYLRSYWTNLFPRPTGWLFYGRAPDTPIKEGTMTCAFNKARDAAGIDARHSFHSLRHSAATHWHERGGDIEVIRDVLGHRNADTTRCYARATGKMFEQLEHPLSGFALLRH